MSEGEQPDDSQKTEEPSAKKLEEARKKGQVALSRELNNWTMLTAATILIGTAAPSMMGHLTVLLKGFIEHAHDFPAGPGGLYETMGKAFSDSLGALALPFVVLMVVALLSSLLQVGPLFAPETIKPDLSKISFAKGFERLFSRRSLLEFVKGLLKLVVVALVGVMAIYPAFDNFEQMIGVSMGLLMDDVTSLVLRMMTGILIVLLVIAAIDVVYQRYEFYQKMRMTKQEVKDEYKQSEGDPHVKARLRQLRSERARQRMMQAVPKADVVITNPTHYSVALRYDPDTMDAPICVAKGVDHLALRIREIAREHDILIYENVPLARSLYDSVEIDEIIPPTLYKAVAEVISYVFKVKGRGRL